jgi:hypothetical protein
MAMKPTEPHHLDLQHVRLVAHDFRTDLHQLLAQRQFLV